MAAYRAARCSEECHESTVRKGREDFGGRGSAALTSKSVQRPARVGDLVSVPFAVIPCRSVNEGNSIVVVVLCPSWARVFVMSGRSWVIPVRNRVSIGLERRFAAQPAARSGSAPSWYEQSCSVGHHPDTKSLTMIRVSSTGGEHQF